MGGPAGAWAGEQVGGRVGRWVSEYPGPSQAIYYFVVMVSPRFASFSEIVQVRNPEKEAGGASRKAPWKVRSRVPTRPAS